MHPCIGLLGALAKRFVHLIHLYLPVSQESGLDVVSRQHADVKASLAAALKDLEAANVLKVRARP